jgi:hypothetical protein
VSRGTRDPSRSKQIFGYRAVTFFAGPFQTASPNLLLLTLTSHNPKEHALWFRLFRVRSPLLTESHFVFFSSGYLDVSVPLVCLYPSYVFRREYVPMTVRGFPHSDIPGSTPAYGSPRHFGVRPVLRRLLAPRHPPYALSCLSTCNSSSLIFNSAMI